MGGFEERGLTQHLASKEEKKNISPQKSNVWRYKVTCCPSLSLSRNFFKGGQEDARCLRHALVTISAFI